MLKRLLEGVVKSNDKLAIIDISSEGLNLVRKVMSLFPNNTLLIQFFAYFNTALFFVENSRKVI